MKKILLILLSVTLLVGCSNINKKDSARTVRFYGWGGDDQVNAWLDGYVKDTLKEEYNINFVRVGMDISDIISILANEKSVTKNEGEIDLVWINGANFAKAKEYEILQRIDYDKIPNYQNISSEEEFLKYDFEEEIDGYEVPFGLAQFTFVANTSKINNIPKNTTELLEVAKQNPKTITYPAATDFTGGAFIRNICYDVVGYEKIAQVKNDKEEMRKTLKPCFDYLNELEKYLWENGDTYPKDEAVMQQMYADGQLAMTMSYTALLGTRNVNEGIFPNTSENFVFENGNIGNSHYLAIPFNAPNTKDATRVIDFLLSSAAQSSKVDPKNWGDLPVITYSILPVEEQKMFDAVYEKVDVKKLTQNSLPEVSGEKTVIINELWEEEVLKK